jgi:hypothetical protein
VKVVRNTPEQLIVGDSPWATAIGLGVFVIILFGAGLMLWENAAWLSVFLFLTAFVVGFVGLVIFVNRVQVIFLRPENRLLIRRRSVFGRSSTEHDLSQLIGAIAEEFVSNSLRGRKLHRPTLVFQRDGTKETVPIVEVYSNEDEVHVLVDAINDWLPADKGISSAK